MRSHLNKILFGMIRESNNFTFHSHDRKNIAIYARDVKFRLTTTRTEKSDNCRNCRCNQACQHMTRVTKISLDWIRFKRFHTPDFQKIPLLLLLELLLLLYRYYNKSLLKSHEFYIPSPLSRSINFTNSSRLEILSLVIF